MRTFHANTPTNASRRGQRQNKSSVFLPVFLPSSRGHNIAEATSMAERRSLVVISLEVIFGVVPIMVGSIPALISAAIALGTFKNSEVYDDYYDYYAKLDDIADDELRRQIYTATVMAIIFSLLGIIIKLPLILLHFLTIFHNVVDMKTKLLHVLDIVTSFVLACGHAMSGILLIVFSNTRDWSNLYSYDYTYVLINGAMTASGAFCFIGAVLYIGVAVFMLFFFYKDWVRTRVFTPAVQTQEVTNEPDEQEVHVNEETTSLIT